MTYYNKKIPISWVYCLTLIFCISLPHDCFAATAKQAVAVKEGALQSSVITYTTLMVCLTQYPKLQKLFKKMHTLPVAGDYFAYRSYCSVFEQKMREHAMPDDLVAACMQFNTRMTPRRKKKWWKKTEIIVPVVASVTVAGLAAWYLVSQRRKKPAESELVGGCSDAMIVVQPGTGDAGALSIRGVERDFVPETADSPVSTSVVNDAASAVDLVAALLSTPFYQNVETDASENMVAQLREILTIHTDSGDKSLPEDKFLEALERKSLVTIIILYKDANKKTTDEILKSEVEEVSALQLIIDRYLVMRDLVALLLKTPKGREQVRAHIATDAFIAGNVYPVFKLDQYVYIMDHGLGIRLTSPIVATALWSARQSWLPGAQAARNQIYEIIKNKFVKKIKKAEEEAKGVAAKSAE